MSSDFETIIKQKLESRTYDFQESSWKNFQEKQRLLKLKGRSISVGISLFILGGLTTILTLMPNTEVSIPESPVLEKNNFVIVQDTLNNEPQIELLPVFPAKVQSASKSNVESSELILELPEPQTKDEVKIKTDSAKSTPQKKYYTEQEDSILLDILKERQYRHDIPVNSAEPNPEKWQTPPRKNNKNAR